MLKANYSRRNTHSSPYARWTETVDFSILLSEAQQLFRLLVRLWRSIIEPNRAAGSHSKTIYSSLCRTFPFVRIARLEKRDFCITDRYTSSRASLLKIRTQSCESAGNSNGIARGKRVFLPSLVVSLIFEVAFSPKFGSEIKLSRASINFTA